MNTRNFLKIFLSSLLICVCTVCFAQQTEDSKENSSKAKNGKGFHFGFFVGALFANKYTAGLYDGYGYDYYGIKNNFQNSFMYRKIITEYGGGNGQPDRIAQALNVNHGDWFFDEFDMPVNLKYAPAFLIGLQMRYGLDSKNTILLNVNGSKLTVNGNFTITTATPFSMAPTPTNIRTFPIIGGEQRVVIQLGYQRILGDNDKLNFFVEGGFCFTMTKFDKNQILINGLQIDLSTFYSQQGYVEYRAKNLTGIGFGAFGGIGINLSMSPKWTMQLVYNPSYEKIGIGDNPSLKLQNGFGLRAYYNL